MYEQHFEFQTIPFSANPVECHFFESESSTTVMQKVLHTLQSSAGVAVITGPEGVGKTVLLNQLQVALTGYGKTIILPGTSLQSTDDLYLCIRRSIKSLDDQFVTGGSGRWEIVEQLQRTETPEEPVVLLVDDAHLLPTVLFTEFQFLMEQRSGSQPLCRVLLAGSLALEETLAEPATSGFAQRIRSYTFLQPLRPAESVEYLSFRLSNAGGSLASCFDTDAVELIVEAADGSPRCLNLLADESLVLAFRDRKTRVTSDTVRLALSGLQHLPHAWNISVTDHSDSAPNETATSVAGVPSASDGVIEIGAQPDFTGGETGSAGHEPVTATSNESADRGVDGESDNVVFFGTAGESETIEDLPILDDLTKDPWPQQLPDAGILAPPDDDPRTVESEHVSDTGFRLADLESVGDPSMEVDHTIDRRLAEIDTKVNDESVTGDALSRLSFDILPDFHLWQPAGHWDPADCVIRYWAQLDAPAHQPATPINTSHRHDASKPVRVFEFNVPAIDEPQPVWPPQTTGISPVSPVPVTVLTTSPVCGAVAESASTSVPPLEADTTWSGMRAERPTADKDARGYEWYDGQLLKSLVGSGQNGTSADADTGVKENSGELVPLKIAEHADESADSPQNTSGGEDADHSTPVADHMFTLPISVDNVIGNCEAHSPPPLESDGIDHVNGGSTHAPHASARPSMPPFRSRSAGEDTGTWNSTAADEDAAEDLQRHMRPRLLSEATQVLSSVHPSSQYRLAAGAENSIVPTKVDTALSVANWDEHSEAPARVSTAEDVRSNGYRNLFTRMRRRQRALSRSDVD